jgi:hypothetical protein
MDVNAIWAPHALESIGRILEALRSLGVSTDSLARAMPNDLGPDTPLGRYARDPTALRAATEAWRGAWRHFLVRLAPDEVRSHVGARLAAMPDAERAYWSSVLGPSAADRDSLTFLTLSLDGEGRPIGVANTDVATRLFLDAAAAGSGAADESVLRDVRLFVRAYPVGLFIDRVGPVVANDAYAPPPVWRAFERDQYHSPRVVWGREVNLFLAGVANQVAGARDAGAYTRELRSAIDQITAAVQASGFRSELWSYEIRSGRVVPVRYGVSSDVQLWSTTDLAVQYALARLK